MKDALGSVQSVLVIGGNSDIAVATVKRLAGSRARKVVLAGRNPERLELAAKEISQAGATDVSTATFDALDFSSHASFVDEQFEKHGGFDLVLIGFGLLGDQKHDEKNFESAVKVMETNYTGSATTLLAVSNRLRQQGHGTIVFLSSVAAERARAANFIYGSTKAGIDAFCQGLGDSLVGTGVSLLIVRPGWVQTKMTAHMSAKPMATTPEAVAESIVDALGKGSPIVWSPAKLRFVFMILRHLPRPIFRRAIKD